MLSKALPRSERCQHLLLNYNLILLLNKIWRKERSKCQGVNGPMLRPEDEKHGNGNVFSCLEAQLCTGRDPDYN